MAPALYALVLLLELAALSVLYAVAMPEPSSAIGTALGWGALLSMVVMLVYSVARRSKPLRRVMRLSSWLNFHIFLGFQGVLFAFFHSIPSMLDFHVACLNPGFLSGVAATIVFCSGLFGRFLYGRLPRGADGEPLRVHRLFAAWILLHRPLAAGMYVVALVHIALSYMFSPGLS